MKLNRRTLTTAIAAASLAALLPATALAQKKIVLGFSQVGAESEWRTANTESIKSAAKEAGIDYHVPFGGRKASGYGAREQGRYAAEFYTMVKTGYMKA